MNARDVLNQEFECELTDRNRTSNAAKASSSRHTFGKKRGKSPQQFNGMHRRRRKKIRW